MRRIYFLWFLAFMTLSPVNGYTLQAETYRDYAQEDETTKPSSFFSRRNLLLGVGLVTVAVLGYFAYRYYYAIPSQKDRERVKDCEKTLGAKCQLWAIPDNSHAADEDLISDKAGYELLARMVQVMRKGGEPAERINRALRDVQPTHNTDAYQELGQFLLDQRDNPNPTAYRLNDLKALKTVLLGWAVNADRKEARALLRSITDDKLSGITRMVEIASGAPLPELPRVDIVGDRRNTGKSLVTTGNIAVDRAHAAEAGFGIVNKSDGEYFYLLKPKAE